MAQATPEFLVLPCRGRFSLAEDQVSRAQRAWRARAPAHECGTVPKLLRRPPQGLFVCRREAHVEFALKPQEARQERRRTACSKVVSGGEPCAVSERRSVARRPLAPAQDARGRARRALPRILQANLSYGLWRELRELSTAPGGRPVL